MAQIIKSISISREEDEFLTKNNISPSKLIQNKVREMINFQLEKAQSPELLKKIQRLAETIQKQADFINEKGLLDEFIEIDDDGIKKISSEIAE